MEISEYKIRFKGSMYLEEPLELDKKYSLAIKGAIIKETDDTNHDGSLSKTYTLELEMVDIVDDKGQVIRTQKGKSMSQKMRSVLYYEAQRDDIDNIELYYETAMKKMLVPEIWEQIIKLIKK